MLLYYTATVEGLVYFIIKIEFITHICNAIRTLPDFYARIVQSTFVFVLCFIYMLKSGLLINKSLLLLRLNL